MKYRFASTLAALALIAGCASPGGIVTPPDSEQARRPPSPLHTDGILLLYAHGSRQEFRRDRCFPNSFTTPRWLRRFADMKINGLPVSVYATCTASRTGDYQHHNRIGTPKVELRARDLEAEVARFIERGFDPGRIFLLGHSAGGWASLWALRDGDPPIAGVIAFAPAFAGPLRTRSSGWQWLRDRHARTLAASERLPALIFAYRGDAFETPAALSFLRSIGDLEMITLDPASCPGVTPHRGLFSSCVMNARQRERILGFIRRRLAD